MLKALSPLRCGCQEGQRDPHPSFHRATRRGLVTAGLLTSPATADRGRRRVDRHQPGGHHVQRPTAGTCASVSAASCTPFSKLYVTVGDGGIGFQSTSTTCAPATTSAGATRNRSAEPHRAAGKILRIEGAFVFNCDERCDLYPLPADDAQFGFDYPVAAFDHNAAQIPCGTEAVPGRAARKVRIRRPRRRPRLLHQRHRHDWRRQPRPALPTPHLQLLRHPDHDAHPAVQGKRPHLEGDRHPRLRTLSTWRRDGEYEIP